MAYYKKNREKHISLRQRKRSQIWGVVLCVVTIGWIYVLNTPWGSLPAVGKLLDPIDGCMANAEPVHKNFDDKLELTGIKQPVTVWLDDRMVPHIRAQNSYDVYYTQGYVHAYFRLWQMDMQTRAAAGRVSEVTGVSTFDFDRRQRRKGMVYAAEQSLKTAEADQKTKGMLDAYTAGVNAFIDQLSVGDFPLEYKLMGFVPEQWNNLKCMLLLKYMADDLTGKTDDIPHSYLKTVLPKSEYDLLFPDRIPAASPVIPVGTKFDTPSLAVPSAPADSVAFPVYESVDFGYKREEGKGSNNWAISGSRTASGVPLLCNDPHLALNLPSLWFETQLQTPDMNVYGASLPGAPGVIIGFNDNISWGLTNNYRDVKDFFEIKRVAGSSGEYWFAGRKTPFNRRKEVIKVKGKPDFAEDVLYTVHGPLMYDERYNENGNLKRPLAMSWMGLRGSNEIMAVYGLNRATNYDEFVNAILHFECPAQNMIYADKKGNIALWGQGQFVNKWPNQGEYVMNGWDSATLWGQLIPMRENPHALNPEQGYLSSANQLVTDDTYPYWYNGDYTELRAWRINQALSEMKKATVEDMFTLQNDNYSVLAGTVLPVMLQYCKGVKNKYLDSLRNWNHTLDAYSMAGSIFQLWWRNLYLGIWNDDFRRVPENLTPAVELTMQFIVNEPNLKYYDNRNTPQRETLKDIVLSSLTKTTDSLNRRAAKEPLAWYKAKNTSVTHLARLAPFSYSGLATGGWGNTVNAMKNNHGPSWRMVVKMSETPEAWGVYPGGQSGNPGSIHYADYLKHWEDGKYYKLLFLPNTEQQHEARIKYTWTIQPDN